MSPVVAHVIVRCDRSGCDEVFRAVGQGWTARTEAIAAGWRFTRDWRTYCPAHAGNPDERADKIIRLYTEDRQTMQAIGDMCGLTRERVRQILKDAGYVGAPIAQQRRAAAAKDRREAVARERARFAASRPPCLVCGGPNARRADTCSALCVAAWSTSLRYHLDPAQRERHRLQCAQAVLRSPDRYKASAVALAQKVVDGTAPPPNRHWIAEGSAAAFYIRKLDLDIPIGPKERPSLVFTCAATNCDGTPCSRHVREEGALCHIHTGAIARARWAS